MRITAFEPTVFLKRTARGLAQLARVTIDAEPDTPRARLRVVDSGHASVHPLGRVTRGSSTHDVFLPVRAAPRDVSLTLIEDGRSSAQGRVERVEPPRRWVVHVVQRSHHDVGYTDLPSRVLKLHSRYLDEAVELASQTERFTPDS